MCVWCVFVCVFMWVWCVFVCVGVCVCARARVRAYDYSGGYFPNERCCQIVIKVETYKEVMGVVDVVKKWVGYTDEL